MDSTWLSQSREALARLVSERLDAHLGKSGPSKAPSSKRDVELDWAAALAPGTDVTTDEEVLILLALVPHVQPDFYGRLIAEHLPDGGDLPEFGGVRGEQHRGVLPTGETAQFVLAGDDLARRLEVQRLLSSDHWFAQRQVLWLEGVREGEPAMSGRLVLDPEVVERLATGSVTLPAFGINFPAEHIQTDMEWDDAVLHPQTRQQIREIENWVKYNSILMDDWGMSNRVKPGYRVLFHGPAGTGKTLTATLLGKTTDRPVFRIDLSRVVSKYIGETEKNLSRLFDKARHKEWILLFDEADALFGKRTEIRDAHDKYANQEVAYLLQRIETHAGLVILATNMRGNIDDAFLRRFQASVHFPPPRIEERYDLWVKTFPSQIKLADDVDWHDIARRFELTGAGIVGVTHYCALESLADDGRPVDRKTLEVAILRELVKEGRVV